VKSKVKFALTIVYMAVIFSAITKMFLDMLGGAR